jgi:peptide/nickel transport system substrate-binding protein
MKTGNKPHPFHQTLIVLALILGACTPAGTEPPPQTIIETVVVTEIVEGEPVEVVQVVTPTPEPEGPRTLVICMLETPPTLYRYGALYATWRFLEAIEDGPIDYNSFGYQPVILEKLPSLADGDATLTKVTVGEGDVVVDADGQVVTLASAADPPILLIPTAGEEAVAYPGGNFEMEQLSASFRLLPNLKWSDGTPLTAADSVYAFNLASDPQSLSDKYPIERTSSYEATGDLTTVWIGLPGYLDSTYFLNYYPPAPEHVWGQYSAAELLEEEVSAIKPIGWGPYIIDEWNPGESLILHKNPNYFRADEGLPKFDNLVLRIIGEGSNASIAALLAGECDISTRIGADQAELVLELEQAGLIEPAISTSTVFEQLTFLIQIGEYDDGYQIGVDQPDYFSDVRTRRAIAMCINRQALVDSLLFGQSEVLDTYLPRIHPLFPPDVNHYDFDIEAGRALLEEVGWMDEDGDPATPRIAQGVANVPDGTRFEFEYYTTDQPLRQKASALIQSTLAECGIQANVNNVPVEIYFQAEPGGGDWGDWSRGGDGGIDEFGWSTSGDPPCDLYLSDAVPGPEGETWISILDGKERIFSDPNGVNITGFANEDFDDACGTALGSLPGQADHMAAHHEAQRIFAEQLPSIPLFNYLEVAATRKDMCNFIMDPTGLEMWNIEEFDYGEGCEN